MSNIIFAGTPEIASHVLEQLIGGGYNISAVYAQPDRPAGRGRQLQAPPVKQLAQQHHIPVFQPEKLTTDDQARLKSLEPDLMLVVAYGMLLPASVLAIPRLGCINLHVSLLPRWRGAAPITRAIEAGDNETGVSIMQMDIGLDTGPIFKQVKYTIKSTDTAESLSLALADLGGKTLVELLPDLLNGTAIATPQPLTGMTYAKKIDKQEGLINWQDSAEQIARRVQAFNPWPICYSHLNSLTIRIFEAEVIDNPSSTLTSPGTIIQSSKAGIDVSTGQGVLRILKAQLPGGKILKVADLLNSRKELFKAGNIFNEVPK